MLVTPDISFYGNVLHLFRNIIQLFIENPCYKAKCGNLSKRLTIMKTIYIFLALLYYCFQAIIMSIKLLSFEHEKPFLLTAKRLLYPQRENNC